MKTLYDVLGVSKTATAEQIKKAHEFCLDSLTSQDSTRSVEDAANYATAVKEAYAVLSSPAKRADYDIKLQRKQQVTYQVVEQKSPPWIAIGLLSCLLIGGVVYYKIQAHRADLERIALEAEKAKADAQEAEELAAAEQAKLDQQALDARKQAELNEKREMDNASREGAQTLARLNAQEANAARAKAWADQQAANNQAREEALAQARARNQLNSMQRALNMPIPRQ